MDPTHKRRNSILPTTKILGSILPSKSLSNQLSKPNPRQKTSTSSHKPIKNQIPSSVGTYLQAKAMIVSADYDSSKYNLVVKGKHQQHKPIDSKVEKERKVTTAKEGSKEKVEKSASRELVEKKKLRQFLVNEMQRKESLASGKKCKEVRDPFEALDIKRMSVSLGGGRRSSFGGLHIELADALANYGAKVVSVDMPPFMQIHAVDRARRTHDSLEKFTSKTLALTLKKEFDAMYGPAWHCIVGTSFGSFVTHSVGGFLYFSMDQKLYIVLFKTTVQRAD